MNPNQKINREQRLELVDLYIKGGFAGVANRAAELGVSTKYIANAASNMGLRCETIRGRSRYTAGDHRWEWARQRGAVVA